KVVLRIKTVFNVGIEMKTLFQSSTILELANIIIDAKEGKKKDLADVLDLFEIEL
ncbi:MAG: hypothetical protein GY756_10500, partial [bacterium]|nr:hypothetical protein [bacterium]